MFLITGRPVMALPVKFTKITSVWLNYLRVSKYSSMLINGLHIISDQFAPS